MELEPDGGTAISLPKFNLPYNLKKPTETMKLDLILKEISGLSMSADFEKIYAVQDENGFLFEINKTTGKTEQTTKFFKDGDYEGVEVVGTDAFVVKSTGTIYEIKNLKTDKQKTVKYNTFLEKGNDIEGLTYDKNNNQLLLPCKGYGHFQKDKDKLFKPIYAFDLSKMEMKQKPAYKITLKAIKSFLKANKTKEERLDDFEKFFKKKVEALPFSPSAIAIHPQSGDLYILSSVGKTLLVMSADGKILHMEKLKKKVHRQPEGIAFDQDGTLYISNEGKDGMGSIHRFEVK